MNTNVDRFFTLTPEQLRYCIEVGIRRWKTNVVHRVRDQRYSTKRSSLDCDVSGVIGEFAFMTFCGVDPEERKKRLNDTRVCNHRNDRGDAILNGKKIDVKAPIGLHCKNILIRADRKSHPPDGYALILLERPKDIDAMQYTFQRKQENGGKIPKNLLTFSERETITVHFKGFVAASTVLQPCYIKQLSFGRFYQFPASKLMPWKEAFGEDERSA